MTRISADSNSNRNSSTNSNNNSNSNTVNSVTSTNNRNHNTNNNTNNKENGSPDVSNNNNIQDMWCVFDNCLSPAASNLSFILNSPSGRLTPTQGEVGIGTPLSENNLIKNDTFATHFSPSIFSPNNMNNKKSIKLLKKRENIGREGSNSNSNIFQNEQFPIFQFPDHDVVKNSNNSKQSNSFFEDIPFNNYNHNNNGYNNNNSGNDASTSLSSNRRKRGKASGNSDSSDAVVEKELEGNSSNERKYTNKYESPAIITKVKTTPQNISPDGGLNICNCKKSKCLKLYCECFAALKLCENCNCLDCNNNAAHEKIRRQAINMTKEKNPIAFQTKVSYTKGHTSGCNCKQSRCLKKYCECFQGTVYCTAFCKCEMCKNFEGSVDLLSVNKNCTRNSRGGVVEEDKSEDEYHVNFNGLDTKTKAKAVKADYSNVKKNIGANPHDISPHGVDSLNISPPQQDQQKASTRPLKKRRVKDTPTFPFFGPQLPKTPKIIALRCFDFLDNNCLYSSSLVNSLWNKAALDDALWE